MNHRFFACVAVALIACVAVGSSAAVATGPGIETNTSVVEEEPETYAQEIDASTQLVEWSYVDDRDGFRLLFEANSSTRITLTEAVQFSEGAGSGRIYQQRIPEGQTEVFVSVPRRGGQAAVTMTTPQSIQEKRFSYVSTGQAEPNRPPIDYERAQLLIVITAVGAVGLTFGIVRKRQQDEENDWERIL